MSAENVDLTASHPVRLHERLGRGHFGEVFRGEVRPHGEVAVKAIAKPPDCVDWPVKRDDLLREADKLRAAEHERIVRVYGCAHDEQEDRVFIFMEYCPGGSLERFAARKPLPLSVLKTILIDVLMGLEALHQRSMLHRDIKPANVLIDAAGRARLSDFGLVTSILEHGYGSRAGYVAHMAPEIFESDLTTPRTDVWAMGMTADFAHRDHRNRRMAITGIGHGDRVGAKRRCPVWVWVT